MPTETSPPRGLRMLGFGALIVAVAIVAIGIAQRARSSNELKRWTEDVAVPTVSTVEPQPPEAAGGLQLPGRLEAFRNAPIYARANGYLKARYVDIGDAVKAGQVMAEIDTPDLDQQLAQARANLIRAEADARLAESTAKRWQAMSGTDAVSQQEIDEKTAEYAAQKAAVNAARAAVDSLAAAQGFKRIVAPFEGVVTSRTTVIGALIRADGGSGPPLFTVADMRKLRVYVQIPQSFVPAVRVGGRASISVPERPEQRYAATVASASGAVDVRSGASLVQLIVDNQRGELLAGAYADVELTLPEAASGLSIPASSLIFDGSGIYVAVLGDGDRVAMKQVDIGRDLGKTVEVSGLAAGDRIIDSPPDSLMNGDTVRLADASVEKSS